MINNVVVIASTAGFLVEVLREKLNDADFRVVVASNDNELRIRIKSIYPRFIFIEQCFHENATNDFVNKISKVNNNAHIVIWTACDIKPITAARFIHAGAESFFSLRDTGDNIEKIISMIARGKHYYPKCVEAALDCDFSIPVFDVPLTDREIQIIKLFTKPDKEIARILSLSVHTVVFHKTNIYRKCGMKRKNEILIEAIRKGIIVP